MYIGVMGRTQIYLGDEEIALLDRASVVTGASRSELVRRAVRRAYGDRSKQDRLIALKASAGSWSDRTFTGAEYVDAIRGDLTKGLRKRGL